MVATDKNKAMCHILWYKLSVDITLPRYSFDSYGIGQTEHIVLNTDEQWHSIFAALSNFVPAMDDVEE